VWTLSTSPRIWRQRYELDTERATAPPRPGRDGEGRLPGTSTDAGDGIASRRADGDRDGLDPLPIPAATPLAWLEAAMSRHQA
jgi:hypothetical protein